MHRYWQETLRGGGGGGGGAALLYTETEMSFWRNFRGVWTTYFTVPVTRSWGGAQRLRSWQHSLQWRHNGRNGVKNHMRLDCLLNYWSRCRSSRQMETFFALLACCAWNSPVTGEFPAQRPVTRKMFPFDDVSWQLECLSMNVDITLRNFTCFKML